MRIDPYYRFTANAVPDVATWIDELIADTRSTQVALVHGDFSPKNVLIYDDACVLLDHEVGHWGDPGFDIGFATAHFFGKANHLADLRNEFAAAAHQFWSNYADVARDQRWFDDVAQRAVRHSIACTLARVRGKSPLEYLSDDERQRQHDAAVALALDPPSTYAELVDAFVERIS